MTYKTILTSSYDTTTGVVTKHEYSAQVKVTFGNYTNKQIAADPGQIEKNDRPALVLFDDFSGIKPTFDDTLTRTNGEIWKVVEGGVGLDPAEALYVLQTRRIN